MKVFIKKLDGTKFEIEVNPHDTVADVKKIIETVQGENVYPAALQMLIHRGKILKDGTTLKENNVAENDGVLIIESPNKSSSSSAEASTSATTVKGIPQPVQATQLPAVPRSGSNTPAAAPNPLDFLRNSQHFLPLRAMMLSNPRSFEPILNELANQWPGLIGPISENACDFFRLFDEPPEGSMPPLNLNYDDSVQRNWTREESLAIDHLEILGFHRDLISEVFYSCNKDEEATALFLSCHMIFDD